MRRFGWMWVAAVGLAACSGGDDAAPAATSGASISGTEAPAASAAIALWAAGQPAFGMFVPSERPMGARDEAGNRLPPLYTVAGARALADNALMDYLFLNLEGAYDAGAVDSLVAGLDAGTTGHRPTLLVRIPTIEAAGAEATRERVADVLARGADGVVIPHVRSPDEARLAASFFQEAGADVWSPSNPNGTVVAMLMVEDPGAVAAVEEIIAIPGYSMLSCGIGSLGGAMGGDREGAEVACERVMRLGLERGMPSMMTANAELLEQRLTQGYLGILLSGSAEQASDLIRTGHALIGR